MDKIAETVRNSIGQPAIYASTTKGTVKLLYDGHHFRYSFRKGKYSIFQCCYKENKEECKVRVVTDQKRVYHLEGEHVHFVHATDKSVTSVKFTTGANLDTENPITASTYTETMDEVPDVIAEEVITVSEGEEILCLDEHFAELAEAAESPKAIGDDNANSESMDKEIKIQLPESKPTLNTRADSQIDEDSNNFREKIKKRLQKALLGKKKS